MKLAVGSNTSPPKDVQEEEQFRKMQYWIQGVLQTSHQASQVHTVRIRFILQSHFYFSSGSVG